MRTITYRDALREAIREEMLRDERVFIMGEDIAGYGFSKNLERSACAIRLLRKRL